METLCRIVVLAMSILQLNSLIRWNYKRCLSATECSNTSISKTLTIDRLWCEAAGSCSDSTITNMDIVACWGEFSCQSTSLQSISKSISFNGAYSGYNSMINATNNTTETLNLTISYSGYYSGYASKLVCGEGFSCTINCQRFGCYGLEIECLGDNNCLVLNAGNCSTDPGIQSIIPPMLSQPSYPSTNAALCNTDSSTDEYICNGIINASLSPPSARYSWICNEESSCSPITIDNAQDVYCSAVFGCEGSNISNGDNLYCSGYLSCRDVNAVNVVNVYCSGVQACISLTTYNATNVYFIGDESWSGNTEITVDANQIGNIYIYSHMDIPNGGVTSKNINCLEGSTCMISCGIVVECDAFHEIAMRIDVNCFPGSNCTVDCNDCQCNQCLNIMDGYNNELEAGEYVNLAEECEIDEENTDECSRQWDKIQYMWILAVLCMVLND